MYLICHVTFHNHLIEGSCKIMVDTSLAVCHHLDKPCDYKNCSKIDIRFLPPCHACWSLVWRKWRHRLFNTLHLLKKPCDQRIM